MKYVYLLFALFLLPSAVNGQKKKEFYDKNNRLTDVEHSVYYKIVKRGKIETYYISTDKIRSLEKDKHGVANGLFRSYYENGKMNEQGNNLNGRRNGRWMIWYDSGKPHQEVNYSEMPSANMFAPAIINYWDSLGRPLVTNGKGFCYCYEGNVPRKALLEVGKVLDGVRDSVWLLYSGDTLRFKENYNKGKFVNGVRYERDQQLPYTEFGKQPEFIGGMSAMMSFITSTMKYPLDAQRLGIQGKVLVAFVVNKDGSISDVEVARGVSPSIDQEAMRVVRLMPRWNPGQQRGKLVRVKFVLPLNFRFR